MSPESDEGIEVIWPLHDGNEKCLAETYFIKWKTVLEEKHVKFAKACLFHHLNLKVSAMQQWKEFVRRQNIQKEIKEKERAIEQETIKKYLAHKYRERNLCLKAFSAWAMYTKIQERKRQIMLYVIALSLLFQLSNRKWQMTNSHDQQLHAPSMPPQSPVIFLHS